MEADVEIDLDYDNGKDADHEVEARGSNVILVGAMGAGKSTVGWLLARLIGYGFIDVDQVIEVREGKPIHQIFEEQGEAAFRAMEHDLVLSLAGIRSHVIAVGGGAIMDDDSWSLLQRLGVTVWLNPPPEEIARRLGDHEDELKKRPLLAEVASHQDWETRHKILSERLKALIGNRGERYRQAQFVVSDSFSTPESTAQLLRDTLEREGALSISKDQRPYDRWHIL